MDDVLKLAITNWRTLVEILPELREDQCLALLTAEVTSEKPRKNIVERLHQRYSSLRVARERAELMAQFI